VQLLSGKTDSDLRLIESNTLSHTPRYVTLSYCWGGTTAYKLEQLTMATMKSGFTSTILPKTLRDAITVTRELDISYIWIDSLCIIQDLPLDWEKEAREMGKVYSNSYLTIGALGAVSSTQGLFVQRDPLTCTPCWMFQGKDGTDFYVAPSGSCPLEKWYDEAPLHSRGWVMQERLLSPRTLNFGLFVVWECRKELLHELSPTKSCHEQHFKTGRIPKEAFHQKMGNFSDEHISLDFWSESVVYPYTQTKLTNASDRLVALDGMVKSFSQNTGWKNFWGLWEPFLVEQCLWKHEDMGQDMELLCDSTLTSCGSRNPGFPTWSWASLQSPVRYLEILPQMSPFFKAEIQAFSIPSRIDEGGPTTAVLVVSSALFPIKVVESVMEPLWQPRLMLTSSRSVIISRTQRQK
jgi:hypothetical protein